MECTLLDLQVAIFCFSISISHMTHNLSHTGDNDLFPWPSQKYVELEEHASSSPLAFQELPYHLTLDTPWLLAVSPLVDATNNFILMLEFSVDEVLYELGYQPTAHIPEILVQKVENLIVEDQVGSSSVSESSDPELSPSSSSSTTWRFTSLWTRWLCVCVRLHHLGYFTWKMWW